MAIATAYFASLNDDFSVPTDPEIVWFRVDVDVDGSRREMITQALIESDPWLNILIETEWAFVGIKLDGKVLAETWVGEFVWAGIDAMGPTS